MNKICKKATAAKQLNIKVSVTGGFTGCFDQFGFGCEGYRFFFTYFLQFYVFKWVFGYWLVIEGLEMWSDGTQSVDSWLFSLRGQKKIVKINKLLNKMLKNWLTKR